MKLQFSDIHPDICLYYFSGVTVCARGLRDWEISRCNTQMEDLDRSRDIERNSVVLFPAQMLKCYCVRGHPCI